MKYAFFTGAAGGLGSECTLEMVKHGWTVFAADINEVALAEIGKNEKIIPIKVDITNQKSIDEAHDEVKKTTDSLDAIINFAGFQALASMVEGNSPELIEKMFKVNVMGMVRVNKSFFDMVKKGGGRIINCSSECGWMKPQPFNGPYTITKYAVEAYNDSLRRELMMLDIPVIKLQPGSFKTEMHDAATRSFNNLYNSTDYFKNTLKKMKPLMTFELKMAREPKYLVKSLIKAAESDHARIKYRVKSSKLMGLLELFPDRFVDSIYKAILK